MAAGVNPDVNVILLWSYFTTVLNTLLHSPKERGVPMETAVLVLRIVRSCHIIIEYSEHEQDS